MSINRTRADVAYGFTNALQGLSPAPIISRRAPQTTDRAELGTPWINTLTNAYYFATSYAAGGTVWQAQQTGAGVFAAVVVNPGTLGVTGLSTLTGGFISNANSVVNGNLNIVGNFSVTGNFQIVNPGLVNITSTDNAARAIYLHANGGVLETIELHSDQGTGGGSIFLNSDVGGISLQSTAFANNAAILLAAGTGGYTLDGAIASALNVTGAAEDLTLNSVIGSVNMVAGEAAADAIHLHATAGGVDIIGAAGLTITTVDTPISIDSGSGLIDISTDAADTSIHIGESLVNTKLVFIGSSFGASVTAIEAGSAGLSLGTNAAAIPIVIGNETGATSIVLDAGTGGLGSINIATKAHATPIVIGNVTGTTGVTVNTGTLGFAVNTTGVGDITLTSADAATIAAAGTIGINSTGAAIGIGDAANNFAVNVGTLGTRVVTVGSAAATSSTVIHSGSTGITLATATNGPVAITSGTGQIDISANANATSVNLATGAAAKTVIIGSATAGSSLTLNTPALTPVIATNGLSTSMVTLTGATPARIFTAALGAVAPAGALALQIGDIIINTTATAATNRMYIATAIGTWTYIPAFA